MNFADALREISAPLGVPEPCPPPTRTPLRLVEGSGSSIQAVIQSAPSTDGLHVVRFELSLSMDQLQSLLRGVSQVQPMVLTLREASQMLRISSTVLKEMAETRVIPAFTVDGKWRFSRTALETWLDDREAMEATQEAA